MRMIVDGFIVVVCVLLAMVLRFESLAFVDNLQIWAAQLLVAFATILVFYWLGLYHWAMDINSGKIQRAIASGSLVSAATLFAVGQVLTEPFPFGVPIIYAALLLLASEATRLIWSQFFVQPFLSNRQLAIIYGAGDAGKHLSGAFKRSGTYVPLAFVDDDPNRQGTTINDLRVYDPSDIHDLIKMMPISAIVLSEPAKSRAVRREIVSRFGSLGLEIKTICHADECSPSKQDHSIRFMRPQDLFGQSALPPRETLMRKNITGKVVLVTGAGGSIGGELCRQIIRYDPAELVLLDVLEGPLDNIATELQNSLIRDGRSVPISAVLGSVQDTSRITAVLQARSPETIFHCAAYKDVALVEANVVEGIRNNSFGTKVVAVAASSLGIKNFILVSTDTAMRPSNFVAASQRLAELVCQALATPPTQTVFSIVRLGNLFSSTNSTISRIEEGIEKGGPVTIDHPERQQYFMLPEEAAQLIIQAGAMASGGEIYVVDMGASVSQLELAATMIRIRGFQLSTDVQHAPTDASQMQIVTGESGEADSATQLFGNAPEGTGHPRILKATEAFLSSEDLDRIMVLLDRACHRDDFTTIGAILAAQPICFTPNGEEDPNHIWGRLPDVSQLKGFAMLKAVKNDG